MMLADSPLRPVNFSANKRYALACWAITAMLGFGAVPSGSAAASDIEIKDADALVHLGKRIFFDSRFSADGSISCASCHVPEKAFSDGRRVAIGIDGKLGTRNTPSLLDTGQLPNQFWDGRRLTLEDQAVDPLLNPLEHGMENEAAILSRLRVDDTYLVDLQTSFGTASAQVTLEHLAVALAAYQRTLSSGTSPLDRYLYLGDKSALSAAAIRGLSLFRGRAECSSCHVIESHSAPLTDYQFHSVASDLDQIGARLPELTLEIARADRRTLDRMIVMNPEVASLGRFAVTKNPKDIGRFRTPSLRNAALTAPYMHDGSVVSLETAIEFELYYRSAQLNRPLILTPAERADILAFLNHLTSDTLPR